jgi:nucleoside-triphosphatase THEP1
MMLILTGEKGAGKTTLIRNLISEHAIASQGFLSVKEMEGGAITGISLLILPERKLMPMATTTPRVTDTFTKRFYFYPGVFDRVNRHFQDIRPECPFIFDEFGLLEREGKGHYPVFSTLMRSAHPSLIVVRSELTNDLLSLFNDPSRYRTVDMTTLDMTTVRSRVVTFLQSAVAG